MIDLTQTPVDTDARKWAAMVLDAGSEATESETNRAQAIVATADLVEAAFSSVLSEIESMSGECPIVARSRRTASTCYVEALVAYRIGNVDSAAIALHIARFWATGSV